MLPLVFLATARQVVIVGGGAVGRRKAAVCAEARFAVRIIDPVAVPFAGVEWVAEAYRPDHLTGAALAVAAATPVVNSEVVADARRVGTPVCDAASPDAGDFVFPAVVRRGGLTLAVATGGASPTLANRIRERLATEFGPEYGEWVAVLIAVRRWVLETVSNADARRQLLAGFADDRWLDRLRDVGPDAVLAEMLAAVEAAAATV